MSYTDDFIINDGVLTKYTGRSREVVIPDTVTVIGREAFAHRESLESVVIPRSVTEIDHGAFCWCTGLSTVVIPGTVKRVGARAFYWCEKLINATLCPGVDRIGRSAFEECHSLEFVDLYDGLTHIEDRAFCYCPKLNEISVPETVTSVGDMVFYSCGELEKLTFPSHIDSMGNEIFYGCDKLIDKDGFLILGDVLFRYTGNAAFVKVPEGIRTIDAFAFQSNKTLTSVHIPDSVTDIRKGAFKGCSGMVDDRGYVIVRGVMYDYFGKKSSVVIPDTVSRLDKYALYRRNYIKELILPKNLDSYSGSVLKSVWETLYDDPKMKDMLVRSFVSQLPVTILEDKDICRKIQANKKQIIDYAISNDDVDLMQKLFSLYRKLSLDDLNSYIKQAENSAECISFLLQYKSEHYSLAGEERAEQTKVDKELGIRELSADDWKKTYLFKKNGDGVTITRYKGRETDVVIPSRIGKHRVTAIGVSAFSPLQSRLDFYSRRHRDKITSVVIPEGVTVIEDGAFYWCNSLIKVTVPDSVRVIGNKSFGRCYDLTCISLPDGITDIGDEAFIYCQNLTDLALPDSVVNIGKDVFNGCDMLNRMKLRPSEDDD